MKINVLGLILKLRRMLTKLLIQNCKILAKRLVYNWLKLVQIKNQSKDWLDPLFLMHQGLNHNCHQFTFIPKVNKTKLDHKKKKKTEHCGLVDWSLVCTSFNQLYTSLSANILLGVSGQLLCMADMSPFWFCIYLNSVQKSGLGPGKRP